MLGVLFCDNWTGRHGHSADNLARCGICTKLSLNTFFLALSEFDVLFFLNSLIKGVSRYHGLPASYNIFVAEPGVGYTRD